MPYHWRPSKKQRQAFAERMQDPHEKAAYEQRKVDRLLKKAKGSAFSYKKAGGEYVPTKAQHDFCLEHIDLFQTPKESMAANVVMYGYSSNEKVHHDFIHIVNEIKRAYESSQKAGEI